MDDAPQFNVEYEPPDPPRFPPGSTTVSFILGIALGALISAAVWGYGWSWVHHNDNFITAICAVFLGKTFLAIVGAAITKRSYFSNGMMISVALGILIYLSSCGAHPLI